MKIFEYKADIKKDWDEFILNSPFGSIHQISTWKNFQLQIPGRNEVLGFGVKDKNNNILATTWCVQMHTGFGNKYWYYSARGPVFDPEKNLKAGMFLLEEVQKILKKKQGVFWRIDPYFSEKNYQNILKNSDLNLKKSTQDYQPTDTLEIDLTQTEPEILAQMKRRGRNGINKARKKGVKIEIIKPQDLTQKDLDDFYKLNKATTARDKFSGHSKDYYQNFLKYLSPYAVLFFATFEGQRIATAISTFCGDKSIYYFGASTSDRELNKLKAPTLLQWEMMVYAKSKNCKTYDFLGIAPEDQPQHAYAGISQFKHGFGGYRKIYAAGKEIPLNNFWYNIYKIAKKLKR